MLNQLIFKFSKTGNLWYLNVHKYSQYSVGWTHASMISQREDEHHCLTVRLWFGTFWPLFPLTIAEPLRQRLSSHFTD